MRLDADAATALIKAHAAKVDHDENGWTVTLDPDKPPGSQKYALRWCDQTLQLQPGANARFAHDQVKAIGAAENALWLATEAGMVRMSLQPLDGTIRRESGQHLWTACGEAGLEPFEIGRFPAAQGGFVLICRAQGPAGENRLFYDVELNPVETSGGGIRRR